MKPLYFLFVTFLLSSRFAFTQIIEFPDPNFKQALLNQSPTIDTNNDSEISVAETKGVGHLTLSSKSISDLSGIEHFTSLQYLDCTNNSLTSLDVTGLSSLRKLYCYNNSLTNLDVSGLSNLEHLECYYNSLTNLDVSGLSSLQYLDCSYNSLTSLDVNDLSGLQSLNCAINSLTSLDVSGLSGLLKLNCLGNSLTSLDVSGLDRLQLLDCSFNSMISVDLRNTPNLYYLNAQINPDLQCLVVENPNDPPTVYVDIDQNPIPFTKEPCLANFDALKALVDGMVSHSPTTTTLLTILRLAEDGCNHGSKWKAISSLETFILMVQRTRQLGRLTPFEAELLTGNARELIRDIRSGDVACSGQPRNIFDWISQWFGNYNLENPADADTSNNLRTTSHAVQNVYPNPTSGRLNFSQTDQQVVVYNMLGKVIEKAERVNHIDMSEYQPGVYVIQLTKDNKRTVHQVVKE